MSPKKERTFKKSYAAELLRIAAGDVESAEVLMQSQRGRPENVCYHEALRGKRHDFGTRRSQGGGGCRKAGSKLGSSDCLQKSVKKFFL
jgi:hypothetical protein